MPAFAVLIFSLLDPSVLDLMPGKVRSWLILLAALICVGPFIFWQFFGNQACQIEARQGLVRYFLRDQLYADKFALLNNVQLSNEETNWDPGDEDSDYDVVE